MSVASIAFRPEDYLRSPTRLSAPITYFYEGIGEEGPPQITLHQRMQLEIARNFAEIRNERHQEAVSQVARALASR